MKKVILLLAVFLGLAYWSSTVAQVRSEQVVIKVDSNNVIKLKARLFGNFKQLEGLTRNQRIDYLAENYDVGFLFENFRELGWEVAQKPMGNHFFRENTEGVDTLTIITELSNVPINTDHYVQTYFKPKNQKYKFRLDGTEAIGSRVNDFLCEVVSVSLNNNRLVVEKNDTVTLVADAIMEDECTQELTYDWKFSTYDEVIDTVITDTTIYDTTYVNSDWKNWGSGRAGFISAEGNTLVFEVMNNNWDNRRWTVYVSSGVGREVKSNNFRLRVAQ